VALDEEVIGFQKIGCVKIRVGVDQYRSEQGFFGFPAMRDDCRSWRVYDVFSYDLYC
jgi:hypothetical protein